MSNAISNPQTPQVEPWLRLWMPEHSWNEQRGIDDDFLSDHGTRDGIEHLFEDTPPGIGPLSAFASVPFVMLLGRPGAGKSQEVRAAEKQGWLGNPCVLVEAKEIGTENPGTFIQAVLGESQGQPARIIIDGLDEVLLQNSNFIPQLRGWLRRHLGENGRPIHRLAISCRWADWPVAHVEELASLWQNEDSARLVLCPLRRSDVVATLKRRFADKADEFWRQMQEHHLVSIACWPQGCLGLMQSFADSGHQRIATSHADAVRDQIVRHCRLADSPDDRVRWSESSNDVEWRQRVAGRIAAAMIWSGRSSLDIESASPDAEGKAITPPDLCTTDELRAGHRVAVTLADVDSVARLTRLLRLMADKKRWVFQSQVHQEWLAADWLAAQNLGAQQQRHLFGARTDGRWRVFPALRSVAAWLARFDSSFRRLLLEGDPLVLLRLDAASLPMSEREEIIEALLTATNEVRVVDSGVRQAHLLSLSHAGLEAQLTRWLSREDVCDPTKELAIEIAEKTRLTAIAPLLWKMFTSAQSRLQIEIAGALFRLARDGFDEQWKAVLRNETPIDAYGELLGAAIDVMVTNGKKMPLRDILDWLVPTRHFEVHGLYDVEARSAYEHMTVDDLPAVFAKLGEHPTFIHDSLSNAHEMNKAAVRLAIQHFDRPEVAAALTDYWYACIAHHAHPHRDYNAGWTPEELGFTNDAQRRKIIRRLLVHPGFEKNTERKWIDASDYLLIERDFEWCLDEMMTADEPIQWRFALAARSFMWRRTLEPSIVGKVVAAWTKCASLREMLPQPQGGETVIDAISRENQRYSTEREREGTKSARKHAKREAMLQQELEEYTAGCRKAHAQGQLVWPGVHRVLASRLRGRDSGIVEFGSESQIGAGDEWMKEAAARFLLEFPAKEPLDDFHGTTGLLALAACVEQLDCDGPIRQALARYWLPSFIATLSNTHLGNAPEGISNEHFASLFPDEFAKAFGEVMRKRYVGKSCLGELWSFREFWTPAMTRELATILREESIQPEGFANGIRYLASSAEDEAVAIASEWLHRPQACISAEAKAALLGASATMLSGRLASDIRPLLGDKELVRAAIFASSSHLSFEERNVDYSTWSGQAIKELAEAAWQAFPILEKHRSSGRTLHAVTGEDLAMDYRDAITAAARSRGIEVAMPRIHPGDSEKEAFERIRLADWNRHLAAQARAGSSWQSLSPAKFFALASRPHARLARNNDELMEAVVECLHRWEQALAAGAWDHLWDVSTKTSRPEKRIAREMRDWLAANLDILAEREVELASEDRADVVVQKIPSDAQQQKLTVIIELKKLRKGNARERRMAMKTQLVDRYLRERHHEGWTHGLYAVAWTPIPASKDDDDAAIKAANDALCQQAKELSVPPFTLRSMVVDARFRGKHHQGDPIGPPTAIAPGSPATEGR